MPFCMSELNPTHKFFWDETEKEYVNLRQVPDAKYQEFRKALGIKQKRTREFDKAGRPVYVDAMDLNEDKFMSLLEMANDYMIESWHLETDKGEEIPCTFENKNKMISECPQFASWLDKCIKKMKDEQDGAGEEVLGN